MATKRQKIFISYFIIKASLFGIGYSRLFDLAANDTWISVILGTLLGLGIILIINKATMNKKGLSLKEYLKETLLLKLLIILLCSYFILEQITTLTNFMTSFYLLNTPAWVIGLCLIITALYIANKGLLTILKTSEMLFYLSIGVTVFALGILLTYVDLKHIMPIMIIKPKNLLSSSIIYALYTTIPLINLLSLKNDSSNTIKIYLITSLSILLLIFVILGIFGPELTKVLRFPEYIVLKRIKLLSFVEKIESLLSIVPSLLKTREVEKCEIVLLFISISH